MKKQDLFRPLNDALLGSCSENATVVSFRILWQSLALHSRREIFEEISFAPNLLPSSRRISLSEASFSYVFALCLKLLCLDRTYVKVNYRDMGDHVDIFMEGSSIPEDGYFAREIEGILTATPRWGITLIKEVANGVTRLTFPLPYYTAPSVEISVEYGEDPVALAFTWLKKLSVFNQR